MFLDKTRMTLDWSRVDGSRKHRAHAESIVRTLAPSLIRVAAVADVGGGG